jgi:sialate O-acetylesterase
MKLLFSPIYRILPLLFTLLVSSSSLCGAEKEDQPDQSPKLLAEMGLPFKDNAVLQREMMLPIWGSSLPEAEVTVTFNGQTVTASADAKGDWNLKLSPMKAVKLKSVNTSPEGKTMTITCEKDGKKEVRTISNLIMGDVWLCAGQSNMAGRMKRAGHPKNYPPNSINDSNYPALRHFVSDRDTWDVCTPESAVWISRVSYFFARRVQRDALVPMGLIVTAVGGSSIESWLNQEPYPTGKNYTKLLKPHVGYGIKGAIWYQGESNEKDKRGYHPKLKSLILGWRAAWGQDDFPLHFVQLPGIRNSTLDNPAGGDGRAEIRQAYVETLSIKNTGMAVTLDIGTQGEHPPNKYDTGDRLARSVLNKVYELKHVTGCPLYKQQRIEGSTIRISFTDDANVGLMVAKKEGFPLPQPTPNAKIDWLSIQAKDGSWHWATGKIDGPDLLVTADGIKDPINVRYAYTTQPLGHLLYNKDGIPVGPFTTCGYDDEVSK